MHFGDLFLILQHKQYTSEWFEQQYILLQPVQHDHLKFLHLFRKIKYALINYYYYLVNMILDPNINFNVKLNNVSNCQITSLPLEDTLTWTATATALATPSTCATSGTWSSWTATAPTPTPMSTRGPKRCPATTWTRTATASLRPVRARARARAPAAHALGPRRPRARLAGRPRAATATREAVRCQ